MERKFYQNIYGANGYQHNESLKFDHSPAHALILSAIRMSDPASVEREGKVNMVIHVLLGTFMHLLAIAMSMTLCWLVFVYPVEAEEDPWEVDLHRETVALRNALFEVPVRKLILTDPIERKAHTLCENDHTVQFSQSALIFLWGMKMMPFISKQLWFLRGITLMPTAPAGHPLCYEEQNRSLVVTHMRKPLLLVITAFVLLPTILADVFVTFVGAKFLFYVDSLSALILKSMAFFLVSKIDEVLFEGMGSRAFRDELASSKIAWSSGEPHAQWDLWGSCLLKLLAVVSLTLFYTRIFHADVQEFRALCFEYKGYWQSAAECPNCGFKELGLSLESI